ncbi:MAG: coproporphyrinogen dehydrogenase HemZ [Eubacteriales bacterium]|nr:coproporphyrinogen dehydrogenase HemZ [Eubacteriales bacterium]
MTFAVKGPFPGFFKELADVVRIFFPEAREVPEGGGLEVVITESVRGRTRLSEARLQGLLSGSHSLEGETHPDPLVEKRLHKRQQKLAVYFALKEATGMSPPWGSLTGIRPARLVYAEMENGLSLDAAARRVRETFDLSPEKAALLLDVVSTQQAVKQPEERDAGIYIGIPFCETRCRYCSFISCQVGDGRILPGYVRALVREMAAVIRLVKDHGLRVRSVYVGGGTPTALPQDLLDDVLVAADPLIRNAGEVTVEAGRPDSITGEKLRIIADHGATRISINPQTMHDQTLQLIGRAHTRTQTEAAYQLARSLGFGHINMDLIAGLPGEDLVMFEQTLVWAQSIAPESLTVHTLSLKRASDMYRFGEQIPREKDVDAMVRLARETARDMGLNPYYLYRQKHMAGNLENVGYAKPGHECLYNMDMMEDTGSVLALGAGGISKRVYENGARILRAPNVKDPQHYISRIEEMIGRKEALLNGQGKGIRRPSSPSDQPDILALEGED